MDGQNNHQDLQNNHHDLQNNHQDLQNNHQDLQNNHQDLQNNHQDLWLPFFIEYQRPKRYLRKEIPTMLLQTPIIWLIHI